MFKGHFLKTYGAGSKSDNRTSFPQNVRSRQQIGQQDVIPLSLMIHKIIMSICRASFFKCQSQRNLFKIFTKNLMLHSSCSKVISSKRTEQAANRTTGRDSPDSNDS
ncbi:hypothetical protein Anas_14706 [Armadillidium nasatum]|uniref:Uncharacterized protein n=1 Tax=Armadillidium nasatum TaxID=96803 RepID=A0A5N5T100_9CRUS|nr:hypothetical protein Anas_14706 [Armadillidium nasatum]